MVEINTTRQFEMGQPNAGYIKGIEKMPTGIEGFDQITSGGLPCQRTSLIMGWPGCGKTVFARQALGLSGGAE
jgi:circadian clock protein KaiC